MASHEVMNENTIAEFLQMQRYNDIKICMSETIKKKDKQVYCA